MSHPLQGRKARPAHVLDKPYAAVTVETAGRKRLRLVVLGDAEHALVIAKPDTEWIQLPADFEIVGPDEKPIRPSPGRAFFISASTFDPNHLVMEHTP